MQKIRLVTMLALLALTLNSCRDEKKVPLTITFKALYGGEPLVKNTYYNYDNLKIRFTKFSTYLSDIELLTANDAVRLSDIEYLDFTPDFSASDSAVAVTIRVNAPAGAYTGMRMGFGVKADLNAKKPASYSAGHPLSLETEYWSGWKSYIFSKIEAQTDTNNDGQDEIISQFHPGSDPVFRTFSFDTPITVLENSNTLVEFDIKKLFYRNNSWWDIQTPGNESTSNDADDIRVANAVANNWDNATTIR